MPTESGSRVFLGALRARDVERARALLAEDPGLADAVVLAAEAPGGVSGFTALHLAVRMGAGEIARLLIDAGAELETRSGEARTPLHDSIEYGRPEITEMLIAAGAEVDVCSAAILGHGERLRELLDRDPDLANDRGSGLSPLGWAAFGNQTAAAAELLARGARLDDGELLCAAAVGHVEVGRLLIEHGAVPDAIDPGSGCNALHAAAGMRYTSDSSAFVAMLLEAGADPRLPARDGRTALALVEQAAARHRRDPGGKPAKRWDKVAALLRAALAGR